MVICTYFLNNTCRFGTNCHNEHVNVKLTLKTDAESALSGKQWTLSCYGPFRDKPCIPNFIEDQSFEEARYLCYEAKQTGNVQIVMNQFAQSVLDAKNKMNMLTNPSDEVVSLVTNLYNNTCTTTPSNVNRMNGGTSAGGIFGGGSGVSNNTTNLFGSAASTTASNPFARSSGAFGTTNFGMPQQNQTTSTNLFGSSSATTNTIAPFGAATVNNTAGNSLFGGSTFSNAGNSPFSSAAGQTTSLFGGANTGGPFSQQPSIGTSPFAQTNQTTTNLFGGAQAQSNPVFGSNATFGKSPFGQSNFGKTAFGQNVQNSGFGAAPAQTNLFGNATQTSSQSIFGGQQTSQTQPDNPFAAIAQSGTTNIFGNAQAQPQQQPPPPNPFQQQSSTGMFGGSANAFGNNQSTFGGSLFGAQTTNQMNALTSAQTATAPPPASLQQQQQSIFGTNSFSAPAPIAPIQQSPFGNGNVFQQQPQQQQPPPPNQSVFGGGQMAAVQSNPFGAQPQPQPQQQSAQLLSKTLYTPMEELDPDEIEAFNSDTFDINKLPTKPPPMELCI